MGNGLVLGVHQLPCLQLSLKRSRNRDPSITCCTVHAAYGPLQIRVC